MFTGGVYSSSLGRYWSVKREKSCENLHEKTCCSSIVNTVHQRPVSLKSRKVFGPDKQIMTVAMVYIKHEMTNLVSLKIETALLWASVNTYVVITGIMPSSYQL
mgnify:CR=1 FL=1